MSNNARVRIEVDDSAIKLLQQNATALYRELSEQAKAQNKDIQAISKSIDEQIKLIAQRNLQLSREANSKLAQDLGSGLIDRETFNRRVARNANDYRLRTKSLNEVREMYMRDFGYSNMIREDAAALFDQFKKGHTGGDFNEYISRRIADYNRNSKQLYLDRVAGAKDSFMAGEITRSEYRDRLNSASLERKHDDAIYRVLKEIAENTKNSTKNISTDDFIRRMRINSASDARRWLGMLGRESSDPTVNARRSAAAAEIRKQWFGGAGAANQGGSGFFRRLPGMAYGELAGGGGLINRGINAFSSIGPMGWSIAAMGALGVGAFMRYQNQFESARDWAVMRNGDIDSTLKEGWSWKTPAINVGMKSEDYFRLGALYSRGAGRNLSSDQVIASFAQQRALGLTEGEYSQFLSYGKYSNNRSQNVLSAIEDITKKRYGDLTRLSDIMSTYSGAADRMLSVTGSVDTGSLLGVINGLVSGVGVQGNQLNRITSSFQGMSSNQNPAAQGIMRRAALKVNPNATPWEIKKMLENPLAYPELINNTLNLTDELGGGGDFSKFLLQSMLPGTSTDDIDKLYNARGSSGFNTLLKRMSVSGKSYEGRAEALTSTKEQFGAGWDAFKNIIVDLLTDASKAAAEINEKNATIYGQAAEKMLESAEAQEKAGDKFSAAVNRFSASVAKQKAIMLDTPLGLGVGLDIP